MASFIRTSDHLTIVFDDGHTATVYPSNGQYKNIVAALNERDYDRVRLLSTPAKVIESQLSASVDGSDDATCQIIDGVVIYNGTPLHNTLTERMLQMLDEGFDVEPMKKFLVNLNQNPSFRAVTELYGFLEVGNLPITDDGYFLAYKKVRDDYKDCYTGKIDNSVGQTPFMDRNKVDEDKTRTCSDGLHFCSRGYLGSFGGQRTMILKINPRDVVAIPADYNDTKGRTCRYEVIGELGSEESLEGAYRDTRPAPSAPYQDIDPAYFDDEELDEALDELFAAFDIPPDFVSDEELNEASAFVGIPDNDVVVVPSDVAAELEADVNSNDLQAIHVPGYNEPFYLEPGQTLTVHDREIELYDLDGSFLDVYLNVEDAAQDNGIKKSEINRVLNGDRKSTHGFVFKYSDLPEVTVHDVDFDVDDDI